MEISNGKYRRATLWVMLALTSASASESEPLQLHLNNGVIIQGDVLLNKPDRLVVDLGFSVLSVPTDAIQRIETVNPGQPTTEIDGLYRVAHLQPRLTVTENVERYAETVLRVKTPVGLGSGFAVHPDGYVITNHHVIDGEYQITLTLFEQTQHELRPVVFEKVRIVALDPHLDLALLKIEDLNGRVLSTVPLGDSSSLVQGQIVFGIGSPLGFDRTVSQGIISLKNRLINGQLYLQSTAQINPGNSGGPLFNLNGEVIGVNNMKIGAVGIEGLSFAIPANTLKSFLDNADAFAFDTSNPNHGFRYHQPPAPAEE